MKKYFKSWCPTVWGVLTVVAVVAAACTSKPNLKPLVEKAARGLPTELPGVGAPNGFTVAENGTDVVINTAFSEPFVKFVSTDSADLSKLKKTVVYALLDCGDDMRALLQQVGNRQGNLLFKDSKSPDAVLSLSGVEIKDYSQGVGLLSKADKANTMLDALTQVDKAGVPYAVGNGVTLVDVSLDKDKKELCLSFTFDESEANLKITGDAAAMMQNYMSGLYKPAHKGGMEFNQGLAALTGAAADAGIDVRHKVKGTSTGRAMEFTYTAGLMGNYVKGLQ